MKYAHTARHPPQIKFTEIINNTTNKFMRGDKS